MLVDPAWYPAHLLGLVGFACVAAGLIALARNPVLRDRLGGLLTGSVVLALGLLGGLAFALATATIAYVDTFDPLFPVAGLAGIWLVATGVIGLARR